MLLIKFDISEDMPSITLLTYYLTNDANVKIEIERIGKIERGTSKNSLTYNLLDVILGMDKKKLKQHMSLCESFEEKSITGYHGFFNHKKTVKFSDTLQSLLLYLIGSLAQLEHYECLGIKRYQDILVNEDKGNEIIANFNLDNKELTSKQKALLKPLLHIFQNEQVRKKLIEIVHEVAVSYENTCIIPKDGINLGSTYNTLNEFFEDSSGNIVYSNKNIQFEGNLTEVSMNKFKMELFMFERVLEEILSHILAIIESKDTKRMNHEILNSFLNITFIRKIQPFLLFVTSNSFFVIDQIIYNLKGITPLTKELQKEQVKDLTENIRKQFGHVITSSNKTEYEELKEYLSYLGELQYKNLIKRLSKETAVFFDKTAYKEEQKLFKYISSKYNQIAKKCPLHQYLKKDNKLFEGSLNNFVKLSLRRNSLGQAQIMKRTSLMNLLTKKMKSQNITVLNYQYLRCAYLKKVFILFFLSSSKKSVLESDYLKSDFNHKVMKQLFIPIIAESLSESSESIIKLSENGFSNTLSISPEHDLSPSTADSDNTSIKNEDVFEAEIIKFCGGSFGIVTLNSSYLTFRSAKRKFGPKYKYGSTAYNISDKAISLMWPFSSIKEVLVKRYNLIRQAVEIYFYKDSKPIFISFFSSERRKLFIRSLSIRLKLRSLKPIIVTSNELFFNSQKFSDQWLRCEISNFEYLMLLNKYSGRSFNDISQYFVFPWVIAKYDSNALSLCKDSFRDLKRPISGISDVKRSTADIKLNVQVADEHLGSGTFQFGSHYMPPRIVLGYFLRIEPFASLLLQFEGGPETSSRMFHDMNQQWELCKIDVMDNKELVPEFFYLPEMFINYNRYSFGSRTTEEQFLGLKENILMRVDQVILPRWAKTPHHFIKANRLALESPIVSLALNNWIDLIFGTSQQDHRKYNRFRDLCDEVTVLTLKKQNQLTASNMVAIQELGINPIKLFRVEHPRRNKVDIERQSSQCVFFGEESLIEPLHCLTLLNEFKFPVNFIEASNKDLFYMLDNKWIYQAKIKGSKILTNKLDTLFMNFICKTNMSMRDPQRVIVVLCDLLLVITSQYHDNTCKVFYYSKQSTKIHSLYFHISPVLSITTGDDNKLLFTGALDGTIAVWDISRIADNCIIIRSQSSDHNSAVVTLDYNKELDILASGSIHNSVALRSSTTWKFIIKIKLIKTDYTITHVRLSPRGYILIILSNVKANSMLMVYTINGERVCLRNINNMIYCIQFDYMGYQFIVGGSNGMLHKFDLLTLNSCDMFKLLDESISTTMSLLNKLKNDKMEIISLRLMNKGIPILLIGTSLGYLISYQNKKSIIQ